LSVSTYADESFNATDKVLYFNSEVLADVITNTFPNDLQLGVAERYTTVMDDNGNVSIADLVDVCNVGNLDKNNCRGFIDDLIGAAGDGLIKSFFWTDYAKYDFSGGLNIYNSGDGYFHDHKGLDNGEWAIQFPWMRYKTQAFRKQYPNAEYLLGTSACTNESGTTYTSDASKSFSANEQSGSQCWCKVNYPENSPWVYYGDKSAGVGGSCVRSCALSCMAQMRDNQDMRMGFFEPLVKVNVSDVNMVATKSIHELTDGNIDSRGDFTNDLIGNVNTKLITQHAKIRPLDWNKNQLRGDYMCNNKSASESGYETDDTFYNEYTGNHCWCQFSYPRKTKWVYAGEIAQGSCASHAVPDSVNSCEDCCSFKCDMNIFNLIAK